MNDFSSANFQAPGPIAAQFINSEAFVNTLVGPVGSGKTNSCIMRMIKHANTMPVGYDGMRLWKGMVVRDTYRNLYDTTIATWHQWFSVEQGKWTGGQDRPANHVLLFNLPDTSKLELDISFKAMQNQSLESITKGWEGAWAWVNEGDLFAEDLLTHLKGRVSQMRYPPMRTYPPPPVGELPYQPQVVIDYNMPDTQHWLYRLREKDNLPQHTMFRQPSGLSPHAENLQNLPAGAETYRKLAETNPQWWVKRFVLCEYGYSRDGQPVYPEYDDARHCAAKAFEPLDAPLRIGLDSDLHPAGVFCQLTPEGQRRVPQEIVPGRMGATRFGELLLDTLETKFQGLPVERITVDPSSMYGADKEGGEKTWLEVVQHIVGLPIHPAVTNELGARLDSVRELLTRFPNGHDPEFLLSPACVLLREGFMSMYRYRRMRVGNTEFYADRPEKNDFSHPHDALQYVLLDILGYAGVTGATRNRRRERPQDAHMQRRQRSRTDFNVMDV